MALIFYLFEVAEVQGIGKITAQFVEAVFSPVVGTQDVQRGNADAQQGSMKEILFPVDHMRQGGFTQYTAGWAVPGLETDLAQWAKQFFFRLAL